MTLHFLLPRLNDIHTDFKTPKFRLQTTKAILANNSGYCVLDRNI